MTNREPSDQPTDANDRTRPTLSAVLLSVAAAATVVNSFIVGMVLLYAFAERGRRGPGDTGPLWFFLLVLVVVPMAAVLGSITSFAGLKVDRRPGRRRWFKVLFCFHMSIIALGLAYVVFCNVR